jgi:hypothetical protein
MSKKETDNQELTYQVSTYRVTGNTDTSIQENIVKEKPKYDKNNHELNNIKYKTTILNNTNKKKPIIDIDSLLEKESNLNKLEPWCKLDKTMKLTKLAQYSDILIKEHNLSQEEREHLKSYFANCLDKKNLQKVKDVTYDKEAGIIKNIPLLAFNNTTRKFLLKKDKHVSTLKSLAPKKKKSNLNITEEIEKLEVDEPTNN